MCTAFVVNKGKTICGFNLDILNMVHKIYTFDDMFYVAIDDPDLGLLPLFGVNNLGEFVTMPTCHPYDCKSDKNEKQDINMMNVNIDLLTKKRSFADTIKLVQDGRVCSVDKQTFMAQLSDKQGNVLQVIPGQGYVYKNKPTYSIMSNFSPFKYDSEKHPYMGLDRYETAKRIIESKDKFEVDDAFEVLEATHQEVCPSVVSFVYDASQNMVYWSENYDYSKREKLQLKD